MKRGHAYHEFCNFFSLKGHSRFRVSAITVESILAMQFFWKNFSRGWFLIVFPSRDRLIASQIFAAIRDWTRSSLIRTYFITTRLTWPFRNECIPIKYINKKKYWQKYKSNLIHYLDFFSIWNSKARKNKIQYEIYY